jgi:hypothetical protein
MDMTTCIATSNFEPLRRGITTQEELEEEEKRVKQHFLANAQMEEIYRPDP